MTEKIKQFDTWFANAKSGDTYKYFTGNLYGKLFAIKDMQIYLLKEEEKINEEIERCEGLEKLKERKKWKK